MRDLEKLSYCTEASLASQNSPSNVADFQELEVETLKIQGLRTMMMKKP